MSQRRYEDAWDDSQAYEGAGRQRGTARWPSLRRFASSRSGRVVMVAPVVGLIGAYILHRRRR